MGNEANVFTKLAKNRIGDSYRWLVIATGLYIVNKLVGAYVVTIEASLLPLEHRYIII